MENRIKAHENDRYITTQDGDVYDRLKSSFVENIEVINTYEKMPNDDSDNLLLEFAYPAGSASHTYKGTVIGHQFSLTFQQINTIRAALHAQGRTQSAVPEALRTLDWERDLDLLRAEVVNDVVATLRIDRLHQLIEALSAAPPVTGGAWLPIESAPKDGTRVLLYMTGGKQCVARTEHHPFGVPMWVVYGEMGKPDCWCLATEDEETTPTHWQPLPTPPSSEEKEGV